MSKLLIIGGSGFFGKSILDAFRRDLLAPWGIQCIEIVARKASNLLVSNPELISEKICLRDLDITNCTFLPEADYIIHAAASADAKNYLQKYGDEKNNILLGISNFCKLTGQFSTNSKILYVSSGAVYGRQPREMAFIDEESPFQDLSTLDSGKIDYASAKRVGEACIQELGINGLKVSIARCFSFLGPYLPRDQHFAIGNFIEDGIMGRPIKVNAKCLVYRSYLHADELVLWLMTIINSANQNCPIVNVGSDEAIEIRELAKIVANLFSVEPQFPELNSLIVDRYVPLVNKAIDMGCGIPNLLEASIASTIKAINKRQ